MPHDEGGPDAATPGPQGTTQIHVQSNDRSVAALADLAAEINAYHEAAERAIGDALHNVRGAGELLIQAKAQVQHGEWQPWLKANFRGSNRTARAYMQIARSWPEIEAKTADSAILPASIDAAVKLLAEPRQRGDHDPPSERDLFEEQQQLAADRIRQQWALGGQLNALKAYDSLDPNDHDALVAWSKRAAEALGHKLPLGETRESKAIGAALDRCEAVIEKHLPEVERIFALSDLLVDGLQLAHITFPPRGEAIFAAVEGDLLEILNAGPVTSQGDDYYHVYRVPPSDEPDGNAMGTYTSRPVPWYLIVEWVHHSTGNYPWNRARWCGAAEPVLRCATS